MDCLKQAAEKVTEPEHKKPYEYWVEALETNPYRSHRGIMNGESVCSNNQYSETLADRFAVEVMASEFEAAAKKGMDMVKYLQKVSVSQCASFVEEPAYRKALGVEYEEIQSGSRHPTMEKRINKLIFGHPRIRTVFGCGPAPEGTYCEI